MYLVLVLVVLVAVLVGLVVVLVLVLVLVLMLVFILLRVLFLDLDMLYESPRRKPGWRFTAGVDYNEGSEFYLTRTLNVCFGEFVVRVNYNSELALRAHPALKRAQAPPHTHLSWSCAFTA